MKLYKLQMGRFLSVISLSTIYTYFNNLFQKKMQKIFILFCKVE